MLFFINKFLLYLKYIIRYIYYGTVVLITLYLEKSIVHLFVRVKPCNSVIGNEHLRLLMYAEADLH